MTKEHSLEEGDERVNLGQGSVIVVHKPSSDFRNGSRVQASLIDAFDTTQIAILPSASAPESRHDVIKINREILEKGKKDKVLSPSNPCKVRGGLRPPDPPPQVHRCEACIAL